MHGVLRSHAARDSLVGTTIDGRYRLIARIGAGGMGVVYEAEHVLIGRRFALKLMNPEPDYSDELFVRFQREAMAAASIGNPHIVDVTDMGVLESGAAYLVLELLEGVDLAQRVSADGPFSVGRAVHIALQLCDALEAVHEKRIVHRDLKPENVMLIAREGAVDFVKVLDFGICKLLEGGTREAITRTNASLGTPQFMAPEQFRGSARVDGRADVHAVGAILYFMLTGAPPYEAEDLPMLLMRICTEAPPSARMLRHDVPLELDHVIKQACAKRADERYQTAGELAQALLPFASTVEARRISGVARTAREVASSPPLPPPAQNATAHSWPAVESGAIGVSQLPLRFSGRATRVAVWFAAVCVALALIALLARRERIQQPAKALAPAATPVEPVAEPEGPMNEARATPAVSELATGLPAPDDAASRRVQPRKRVSSVEQPALRADQPADESAPVPQEVAPAPDVSAVQPSSAGEIERYRYPRRELRDEN